jgi:UDP-N-acetylglucosamine 3-dehydrogenase
LTIKVGLLGAGFIGTAHAQAYAVIEEAQLVAVADVKREAADRLAESHGARAYHDIEALLADDEVEAIDVCLPTFLHERCVVLAARRGKHVLCEKPIALTLEEVDRMISAVQEAGGIAMVAQVIRFWPQYVVIRDMFERGELGRPLIATAARLAQRPGWSGWFKDPSLSGGALVDLHIHDLDYICSLFGKPRSVYAVGLTSETGAWDHVVTSLDYGDKRAVAEASYLMPEGFPFQMAFGLLGTDGCAEYRFRVGGQVDQREEAETELVVYRPGEPPERPSCPQADAYVAEVAYFVNCVAEGRQPALATLGEARTVLEVALAARRSLETGLVIQL